jgi:hypothetical protein
MHFGVTADQEIINALQSAVVGKKAISSGPFYFQNEVLIYDFIK